MAFLLTDGPVNPLPMEAPEAGGFVCFEGKVRSTNLAREVTALEYEAYPEMAVPEGEKLLNEAIAKFGLIEAKAIHRTGRLEIGDTAVWIGVSSGHRREAFAACEWIIDELKQRVPIWKKEHYREGDSGWIGADLHLPDPQAAADFYRAPSESSTIGVQGLSRLRQARVLSIGAGGTAGVALPLLAGLGVGTVTVIDGGAVELEKLGADIVFRFEDQGRSRAERLAAFLLRLNPYMAVHGVPDWPSQEDLARLLDDHDLVLIHSEREAVDLSQVQGRTVVAATVGETVGTLTILAPGGPCVECAGLARDKPSSTGYGPAQAMIGALMADAVRRIVMELPNPLQASAVDLDLRNFRMSHRTLEPKPDCPRCAAPN